jgi:hypothetical protein
MSQPPFLHKSLLISHWSRQPATSYLSLFLKQLGIFRKVPSKTADAHQTPLNFEVLVLLTDTPRRFSRIYYNACFADHLCRRDIGYKNIHLGGICIAVGTCHIHINTRCQDLFL